MQCFPTMILSYSNKNESLFTVLPMVLIVSMYNMCKQRKLCTTGFNTTAFYLICGTILLNIPFLAVVFCWDSLAKLITLHSNIACACFHTFHGIFVKIWAISWTFRIATCRDEVSEKLLFFIHSSVKTLTAILHFCLLSRIFFIYSITILSYTFIMFTKSMVSKAL